MEEIWRNWSDLIKPSKVEVEKDSGKSTDRYAKFRIEPLERGFGVTIGNALRRVLLSSLRGAAITSLRIDGVSHEFSTHPGLFEDVTDVVLNIKGLEIFTTAEEVKTFKVVKKGPCEVRAKDIDVDATSRVLNPEHYICTLSDNAKLNMELTVKRGYGYVAAEDLRSADAAVDTIFVDALFSPVKRVNYKVENARVGNRTDYDALQMEVWTNGSVKPEDALGIAAKILQTQFAVFINFDSDDLGDEHSRGGGELSDELNENLYRTVDELELSVRSMNCLQKASIKFIGELVQKSEAEMLKQKNFGRKSLKEIKDILQGMGLRLGMKLDGFDPSQRAAKKKAEY
jgi:DNA-directed RNA polymerase subunit alpha